MQRNVVQLVHLGLAAALAGQTGCFTLVGLGVGAAIDAQAPDTLVLTSRELASIGTNMPARLSTVEGQVHTVTIVRPELEPEMSYRARVSSVRTVAPTSIPLPPDTVRAVVGRTLYRDGVVEGYEHDGIWFAPNADRQPFRLSWERVTKLRASDGRVWTGDELRVACAAVGAPTRLGLLVRPATSSVGTLVEDEPDGTTFIPASAIRTVVVPNRTHNIWWGLIAGLVADVAVSSVFLRDFGPGAMHLNKR